MLSSSQTVLLSSECHAPSHLQACTQAEDTHPPTPIYLPSSDATSGKHSLNSCLSRNSLGIPPMCSHIPLFLFQSQHLSHCILVISLLVSPPDRKLLRPGDILHSPFYLQDLTRYMTINRNTYLLNK